MRRALSAVIAMSMLGLTAPAALAAPAPTPEPVINEFVADHKYDDDHAFIEVYAPAGSSTSGLTLLEIEGDASTSGQTGTIDYAQRVSFTDENGYWVSDEDVENGTITLLLVRDFVGAEGDDLDTDDDGVLDETPWSAVVDAVAVTDKSGPNLAYSDVVLAPGFGGSSFAVGGASRLPNGADSDAVDDWVRNAFDGEWYSQDDRADGANTPWLPNRLERDPVVAPDCDATATPISAIQGSGSSSPMRYDLLDVEAVVTAVIDAPYGGLDAIIVQEESTDRDSSDQTSEGLYISTENVDLAISPAVGDVLHVHGKVVEAYGRTQLEYRNGSLCGTAFGSITPTEMDAELSNADRERFEGMLVEVPDTLYVTNLYPAGRFGEIGLATDGILYSGTEVADPGAAANAVESANDLRYLKIDDLDNAQNVDPNPWFKDETSADPSATPSDTDPVIRAGDSIDGITGILDYSFGEFEVRTDAKLTFRSHNPRPSAPASVGGNATIASFNVLNYFTTLDVTGASCGPDLDQDCRGANTATELAAQRSKIVDALVAMDADVVGLMEIENHPTDAALADLVQGLNDVAGPGTYDYIATGPVGSDVIRVALIFQPARASLVGGHAVLDSSVDPDFNDDKNRAALAQSFRIGGETFTVVVNHLKSKGSKCDSLGDPDTGDGQGNCNRTRTAAAEAEAKWLATNPTGVRDADVLVIGDLNAYANEDPVEAFTDAGYVDLVDRHVADGDDYTYVFDGRFGRLDHALASGSLAAKVTGATIWHINSPEVNALTYDTTYEDLIAPGPYASSDHDPVLVGLQVPAAPRPAPAPAPGPKKDDDVTSEDEGVTVTELEESPAGTKPLSTVQIDRAGTFTLKSSEARPSGPHGQMLFALHDGAPLESCATADEPCVVSAAGGELVVRTGGPVTLDIVSLTRACPTALTRSGMRGMAKVHHDTVSCADWWSLVEGYGDGEFGGDDDLLRMQAASVLKDLLVEAGVELPENPKDRTPDYDGIHDRAMNQLIELGVMSGFTDGTSGAFDSITRGQFASMLDAALALALGDSYPSSAPDAFGDDAGDTHEDAIDRLASLGIFTGNADGEAASGDTIERQHAAALIARSLEVWFAA